MNLYDPNDIPGYREAREREQANRDLAFLDFPIPLCGVIVRQFNLKHLVLLGNLGNAFVSRAELPTAVDIAQFLWVVSTEYSLDDKARDKFVKKLRKLKYGACLAEINAYLAQAFQDAPPAAGDSGKLYTSSCASLVELIAHEYKWDDETIMQKPIARLFQYVRLIKVRYNPKALLFNKSDALISENLRARMAPLKTESN